MNQRIRISRHYCIGLLVLVLLSAVLNSKTLFLDESDNHTRVVMYVGDTLAVKLKSNITTGYSWNVRDLPSALQQLEGKSEPGKTGRAGESGFEFFSFKAITPGESTLHLDYFRPFEKGVTPVKTFVLSVLIEQPPGPPAP